MKILEFRMEPSGALFLAPSGKKKVIPFSILRTCSSISILQQYLSLRSSRCCCPLGSRCRRCYLEAREQSVQETHEQYKQHCSTKDSGHGLRQVSGRDLDCWGGGHIGDTLVSGTMQ